MDTDSVTAFAVRKSARAQTPVRRTRSHADATRASKGFKPLTAVQPPIPRHPPPTWSIRRGSRFDDPERYEQVASSRRVHWCAVGGRISLGALGLSLLVGGAQPAEAQAVRARHRSPTAVACTVLSADQIALHSTITVALQSRVTGLQLLLSSGQVGSGASLRLRGNSSIQGSTEPLVYVDGVRVSDILPGESTGATPAAQLLDLINPLDVSRIEVLRGPAATALYGTNAAGGVIHVHLKRGDVDPARQEADVWYQCLP